MKSWVCRQAEWLFLGGYVLFIAVYILFDEGLLP